MHCPECGFVNAEGANYCQKCGAFLGEAAEGNGDTTEVYQVGETGELKPVDLDRVSGEGATLVIGPAVDALARPSTSRATR